MNRIASSSLAALALLGFATALISPAVAGDEKADASAGLLKNDICPLSGKPTLAKHHVDYADDKAGVHARIYFCCPDCVKATENGDKKDVYTKAFLTKKDGSKVEFGKMAHDVKNAKCPVSGDDAAADGDFVNYNAAKVHFCCPSCQETFLKDPDKALGKVKGDIDKMIASEKKSDDKK